MGRAEDQNLAARWRRCTLVSGGGKSTDADDDDDCVSFSGVAVDERCGAVILRRDGEENAWVLLVVKQASSKRCRSNFIVVFRLGA